MIERRRLMLATFLGGIALASPALACRAPAPKDRGGYTEAIDRLFSAWWSRDRSAFNRAFEYPSVTEPFDGAALFDAHYEVQELRFRGDMLFNGASATVQVVTPMEPNPLRGICGGYAASDLFFVSFFPGLDVPVVQELRYLDTDLLAAGEWEELGTRRRS
jgi:hypothetical protein